MYVPRQLLCILALCTALAGSTARADDSDFSNIGKSMDEPANVRDSCRFVDAAAVETLLGQRLAVPPFNVSGSGPDENGTTCRFALPGFRGIDIDVVQKGGDRIFETISGVVVTIDRKSEQSGNLSHILGLAGDWDEVRLAGPDRILALQDDKLIVITATGLLIAEEAIAKLIDAIFGNLDHPLATRGIDGLATARHLDELRPRLDDACKLADDARLATVLGTPTASHVLHGSSCDVTFVLADGTAGSVVFKMSSRGGWSEMAMIAGTLGIHMPFGFMTMADSMKAKAAVEEPVPAIWPKGRGRAVSRPEWDGGFAGPILQGAVKDDVFVGLSVAGSHLTPEQEIAVLATLMAEIALQH